MKTLFYMTIIFLTFSCKNNKQKFNYESSISAKVNEAQIKYLENTLYNFANNSKEGYYYYTESKYLDSICEFFRVDFLQSGKVSDHEKDNLYNHFEKVFSTHNVINLDIYHELKKLPINSISDIDQVNMYFKNNFISILLNNRLLPFNMWGTLTQYKNEIKKGEEFLVTLGNTAWSDEKPHECFLVKNEEIGLTGDNIIDTIHQLDNLGLFLYKTKEYKKGKNTLTFISKLNTAFSEKTLSTQVEFYVK